MKMSFSHLISRCKLLCLLLFLLPFVNAVSKSENYQTYIIHMDHTHKPESFLTHESWHRSILNSLSSSPADDKELLLYSYNHVMHGFSARLTPSQLSEIEESPSHLATNPESFVKSMTTYSPKFLGLQENFGIWPTASYGEDVIVGVVDTGVWPESESFNDKGMPPVPKKWKGKCENGTAFSPSYCNKKLIGARFFNKGILAQGLNLSEYGEYLSPRDFGGHGTHTASTAVGNNVPGVSYFGYARGTAIGMAPRARLAVYKALWLKDGLGLTSDVLAGMEHAILDGVDIMSLSIGFNMTSYFNNDIALGSLSAIEKGIFVVCAASNDYYFKTVDNVAPWITTVGAGTLGREFYAKMTLENGVSIEGSSYFPESVFITDLPLYYGKDNVSKALCKDKTMDRKEVAGKVVICDSSSSNISQQIKEVERAGAYVAIFLTDVYLPLSYEEYSIPSLILPTESETLVKEYVTRVKNPKVKDMRFVLTRSGTKPSPQVASFSSKGPNPVTPGILKPDIIAPGADVLAASLPFKYIKVGNYDLVTDYALMSGTSMATPHVAGVGALLKAIHPKWSPAAIRSAMMTTAYAMDNTGTIIKSQLTNDFGSPLEFGAGHINPNKAMDPGLIYDMGFQDYIEFLCGVEHTKKQMSALIRRTQWSCSNKSIHDLNYPSFTAALTTKTIYPVAMNFSRVVTNVGNDKAVYRAHLENIPTGLKISVNPRTLTFTRKYQTRSFVVNIELGREFSKVIYGFLKWIDQDSHIVSSPIVAINF
ncbi:subtilisin-like protease SBT1.8 [Quercus robur]|uniref:subtilisin-like protease SBT1.8 n=1 Tax=Quercus robur TaxID=38942 RepID=UPI002163F868|nr:subtilisin-like protease SBT1.8 [Quercus robur]XP_050283077.1 subtilisin-like protease SBT1.8 [Quercus robur]